VVRSRPFLRALATLAALLGACRSSSTDQFGPYGHLSTVRAAPASAPIADVELRVAEVREHTRADRKHGREVRLRADVKNRSADPVELLPQECVLRDAGGKAFGAARLRRDSGGRSAVVQPGEREGFDLFFPLRPADPAAGDDGARDLRSLTLDWALRFAGGTWRETIVFDRLVVVQRGWLGPYGEVTIGSTRTEPTTEPQVYRDAAPEPRQR